jgi:hypothetical protein
MKPAGDDARGALDIVTSHRQSHRAILDGTSEPLDV